MVEFIQKHAHRGSLKPRCLDPTDGEDWDLYRKEEDKEEGDNKEWEAIANNGYNLDSAVEATSASHRCRYS